MNIVTRIMGFDPNGLPRDKLLDGVLQTVPSAFNSQPVCMVLLTGDAHASHWKLVENALISLIGQEAYEANTAP